MKSSTLTWFAGLAILLGTLAACASWDFGDVVQTEIPLEIQQRDGLPARMSYNASRERYETWRAETTRIDAKWRESNDAAGEFAGILSGFTLQQLNEYGPMLAGVPVAGPGLVGLSGVLAFWLGRSNLRREKEASYAKARKDVIEDATRAATIGTRIET